MRRLGWLLLLVTGCGGSVGGATLDGGGPAGGDGAVAADGPGAGDDASRPDGRGDVGDAGADRTSIPDATFDVAPVVDAGADVVTLSDGGIGAPCQSNADCPVECYLGTCGPLCLMGPGFGGGYCSEPIAECPAPGSTEVCPAGSSCASGTPIGDYCFADCNIDADCRTGDGYKCCLNFTHLGASVCAPASYCP